MERHYRRASAALAVTILAISDLHFASAGATPASGFTAVQQWKGDYGPMLVKGERTGTWDVKLQTKAVEFIQVV